MRPLLIQDAARDPQFRQHRAISLGLTRYLGVPICSPEGDPIGTLTSWNCTGQDDVVNITEMMAGQTFRVKALKAGTAVLTVKARGDTKNMTASLTIQVKSGATGSKSSSKGFIPGFGALGAVAGAGLALALASRRR